MFGLFWGVFGLFFFGANRPFFLFRSGDHEVIGSFTTTLQDLKTVMQGLLTQLVPSNYLKSDILSHTDMLVS